MSIDNSISRKIETERTGGLLAWALRRDSLGEQQ